MADTFIKIDGAEGESTDEKHKNWIEVLSFSHGITQPSAGSRSTSGAATAGRSDHQDFSFSKILDKASPKLNRFCCDGTHIKNIVVECCRATGDKQKYMEFKMSDVVVTSIVMGGGGGVPTESVSLNYGQIIWTYTMTDHKTGKPTGDASEGWSVIERKRVTS
jgi:type VI secretion system secreted protein Hcp